MQHVKPKWLHNYHYLWLFFDFTLLAAYFGFEYLQASQSTVDYWGITPLILVLAGIHAVYSLFAYPFIRKISEWAAFVGSMVLGALLFAAIIETSNNSNLFYRLGFAVFVFMLNMVGPYLAIASAVVAWVLLLFDYLGLLAQSTNELAYNITINIIVSIAAVAGWFFFKRYYIKKPDKETLAKLENEQVKTNFILASMTDGVVLVDPTGKIEYINPAAESMTGWSKQNSVGLMRESVFRFYDQKHQAYNEARDPFTRALREGKPIRDNNIVFKTKANNMVELAVDATPLLDSYGKATGGVMGVLRDITVEKRQERQRTEFISTASHEMRTPVAAIEGYLSLALNDKVATTDDRAKTYLKKAHASTQHLGQLFQDLLTSSKIDDGRISSRPQVVEIGEMMEKLVEDLSFSAQKKGLRVDFVVGTDGQAIDGHSDNPKTLRPLYYSFVDPDRLSEVITNLFDNAVKYTSKGKISIGITGDSEVVQLYVKDTGSGISMEDISHLFQKFYRVDNTATRAIGGTGLGLFICKNIVELYKGKIWATSELNKGSTFYVNLPRLDNNQARSKLAAIQTETDTIKHDTIEK